MSECKCNECDAVNVLPKFELVDWATEGYTAKCPSCDSYKISYTVSSADIGALHPRIASKMLSEMYDY